MIVWQLRDGEVHVKPWYYEPPFDLATCTGRSVLALVLPKHDYERHALANVAREEEVREGSVLRKPARTVFECTCGARASLSDGAVREDFGVGPLTLLTRLRARGYERKAR